MEAGRTIGGKYRLRKQIGEGAMGTVWSAVHEALDRMVAIKFLQVSGVDAQTASARFVAEAKSAARVKHRYVVDVFDFGTTEDGVHYMVQELLDGEELAVSFDRGPAWPARDAVAFLAECLEGLEAVHQAGVIHRDLKPENVFVVRERNRRIPKLLDFGISKSSSTTPTRPSVRPPGMSPQQGRQKQLTVVGTAMGTPWYMSPEQLRGSRELDVRADVYSIGVIAYEWLTGRVPYNADNHVELSHLVEAGGATPISALRPELGQALSDVVERALSPKPQDRFASAAELREALQEAARTMSGDAWTTVQSPSPGPAAPVAPLRVGPRMGAKTRVLLESASNPYRDDEADDPSETLKSLSTFRIKPWWLVAAAGAALLLAVPALQRSFADDALAASAHVSGASHAGKQHGEIVLASAQRPLEAEVSSARPSVEPALEKTRAPTSAPPVASQAAKPTPNRASLPSKPEPREAARQAGESGVHPGSHPTREAAKPVAREPDVKPERSPRKRVEKRVSAPAPVTPSDTSRPVAAKPVPKKASGDKIVRALDF